MRTCILILLFLSFLTFCSISVVCQNSYPPSYSESDESEVVDKASKEVRNGRFEKALEILDGAVNSSTDTLAVLYYRALVKFQYLSDSQGAIDDLERLIQIAPERISAMVRLAEYKWAARNDSKGAVELLERVHKLEPDSVFYLNRLASMRTEHKDFQGAVEDIRLALSLEPDSVDLQAALGKYLFRSGERDAGIDHLEGFLKRYEAERNGKLPTMTGVREKNKIMLQPGVVRLQQRSGGGLTAKYETVWRIPYSRILNQSKEQQNEILRRWQEPMKLSRAFLTLAELLTEVERFEKALVHLETALYVDSNNERAYALRGGIYLRQADYENAIIQFTKAIEVVDRAVHYLNRGTAYYIMAKDKKAEKDFKSFLKLYPEGAILIADRKAASANLRNQQ